MRTTLAIALGGAVGSVGRYWLGTLLSGVSLSFPVSTLVINAGGSFVLGLLLVVLAAAPAALRLGLTVGVCGGFTTFSTFSAELVMLIERGTVARAVGYIMASVVLGALAVAGGMAVGRLVVVR